jgi:hypothetical protein
MVFYHFTLTASSILLGGLFQAESLPQFTVYEGLVSCALFIVFATVLYLKERFVTNRFKEEIKC